VAQPLGLGVMDRMHPFDTRRRNPAAGDKVDADCQHLARGVKINAPHIPRSGNAEGGFKQLVLHRELLLPLLNAAPCRHSARLDCRVLRAPSRVRCAGLRPPLTAPTGRSSAHPTHSNFKRGRYQAGSLKIAHPIPTAFKVLSLHTTRFALTMREGDHAG